MDLNIFKFRYIINIVLRDQRVAFFLLQEWQHYSIMHKHDLTCALIPKYFSSKCEGDSLKGTEDVKVQNYSLQLCIFATTEHADVQTKDSLQEITTSDKYSELAAPLNLFGHMLPLHQWMFCLCKTTNTDVVE